MKKPGSFNNTLIYDTLICHNEKQRKPLEYNIYINKIGVKIVTKMAYSLIRILNLKALMHTSRYIYWKCHLGASE